MKIVAKQKKECDIPKEHCNQHLNSFIHLCYYTFKAWNKYLFFFCCLENIVGKKA